MLFVFGVLWALLGAWLVVGGLKGETYLDPFAVGLVILAIALVEMTTGILASRGSSLARSAGILLALVFGIGSMLGLGWWLVVWGSFSTEVSIQYAVVLVVLGIAHLYTLVVFTFRWRRAA